MASLEVVPRAVQLGFPEVHEINLNWAPSTALEESAGPPMVFIHLRDDRGDVVRTFDHPFPQRWREGVPVQYDVKIYQSALSPPLAAGKYQLSIGLYGKENERWALDGLGKPIARREYLAAEVEVPAPAPQGLRLAFSPSWLALEPGGDRQILARRWLNREGSIGFQGIASPGTVWMVLRIPSAAPPSETLVFDGASEIPAVLVSGTCGSSETNVTGAGYHEVEVPVETVPPGGSCEVALRPNFHLKAVGVPEDRSVSLENITWRPASGRAAAPSPGVAEP